MLREASIQDIRYDQSVNSHLLADAGWHRICSRQLTSRCVIRFARCGSHLGFGPLQMF